MGLIKKVQHISTQIGELDEGGKEVRDKANPFVKTIYHIFRFIQITLREIADDNLPLKSMALTFASLLSFVPFLGISFSLFKLFGGGDWFVETLRPLIMENLAPGTGPRVAEKVQELIENAGSATLGGLGVVLLLVAVYAIFAGIESTINAIWGTRSRAGSLQRLPLYWGLVTIVPILVVGSLAVSTYLEAMPIVAAVQNIEFGRAIINRFISFGMIIAGFFLLYRFVPATRVRGWAALLGAIVAGTFYEAVKATFMVYSTEIVQYDVIYGSLAVFPMLLIWLNLSWIIILGGVEVSFVAQHYSTLLNRPKHVKLSRQQKDAFAYLMLREATSAFRGERPEVTLEEWAKRWNVPPNLAEATAESLRNGGLIERTGKGFANILLARSPDKIRISDIEVLVTKSSLSEWKWPGAKSWKWLEDWLEKRKSASLDAAGCMTLADLVDQMEIAGYSKSKPKKKKNTEDINEKI